MLHKNSSAIIIRFHNAETPTLSPGEETPVQTVTPDDILRTEHVTYGSREIQTLNKTRISAQAFVTGWDSRRDDPYKTHWPRKVEQ